jgi:hypothetical protein
MRVAAFALLAVLGPAVAAPATPAMRTRLHRPRRGFQLRIAPFDVPVGEREVCQAIRLPLRHAVDVDRITVRMPHGPALASHHFAMFLADASAPALPFGPPADDTGCVGAGGTAVSAILAFVQRTGGDVVRFPRGIGVRLGPEQVLLFNSHYVNAGIAPVAVDVAVNFRRARPGTIARHAKSFQLGTLRIDVPPGGRATTTAEWKVPFPMDVVWLSTHSHKHTERADVAVVLAGGAPEPLVETTAYAEPDFEYFTPPALHLAPGDAIRWSCAYDNRTAIPVHFGVTAEDEMCFAVGFFVTDSDGPLPPVPGCFGNGLGLVCPSN